MKKLIITLAAVLFAAISINAQTVSGTTDFGFRGGKYYQNGVVVPADQLCKVVGEQTYYNIYKPAKGLRTAGIAVLSSGGGLFAIGTGLAVGGIIHGTAEGTSASSAVGDSVMVVAGVVTLSVGIPVAIAGGIMLGVANSRLRNRVRPASSGVGISLSF